VIFSCQIREPSRRYLIQTFLTCQGVAICVLSLGEKRKRKKQLSPLAIRCPQRPLADIIKQLPVT
jgi:hypothetical protein